MLIIFFIIRFSVICDKFYSRLGPGLPVAMCYTSQRVFRCGRHHDPGRDTGKEAANLRFPWGGPDGFG
jgi:hypothetical protein